jgi:hypothetical protein
MFKKTVVLFLLLSIFSIQTTACTVVFNTQTFKYHNPNCTWAIKCTKNCIEISKEKAKARGGVACKSCKGICSN